MLTAEEYKGLDQALQTALALFPPEGSPRNELGVLTLHIRFLKLKGDVAALRKKAEKIEKKLKP